MSVDREVSALRIGGFRMEHIVHYQEGVQKEWSAIAHAWCVKNGAELLFVNQDSFGCWKDGQPIHIYVDELYQMMKK